MNLYTDPYAYIRAASGHDTATVIGNLTRINSPGVIAGATSIPVSPSTTVNLAANDIVTIFDGASSEEVTVTATTNQPASSIPCTATQFAHAAKTPLASDGTQGSLAAMIVNASAEIEDYCQQPLLTATYSVEKLPLRSMRAAVSNDGQLILRPRRFPATAVSGASALLPGPTTLTLDTAQAVIGIDGQTVTFALIITTGSGVSVYPAPALCQTTTGFVQLSYTAGYAYSALPREVSQACIWLTSDLLSDRRNPMGAAEFKYGDVSMKMRLPEEKHGESLLRMKACRALDQYRQRAF